MPSLTQTKSYEDLAIRGGNFFQSVFSRNKSDASSSDIIRGATLLHLKVRAMVLSHLLRSIESSPGIE
jgi:hypothetical protein